LVVDAAAALRHDPAPADRESVGLEVEALHHLDVLAPAVVVVASHVAGVAVPHIARSVAEPVPDRRSGAVGHGRAFNLIGGGRSAPQEPGCKQIVAGDFCGHSSGSSDAKGATGTGGAGPPGTRVAPRTQPACDQARALAGDIASVSCNRLDGIVERTRAKRAGIASRSGRETLAACVTAKIGRAAWRERG